MMALKRAGFGGARIGKAEGVDDSAEPRSEEGRFERNEVVSITQKSKGWFISTVPKIKAS